MADIPNCFYRTSVKALILDQHKRFLLIQEPDGLWELPGGGLDFGEDPHEGLRREIKEEMGLEVPTIAEHPRYFFTFPSQRKKYWISNVLYEAEVKDLAFTPTDECVAIRFFTVHEARNHTLSTSVKVFCGMYEPE